MQQVRCVSVGSDSPFTLPHGGAMSGVININKTMRSHTYQKTILNAVTADGASIAELLKDYQHVLIEVAMVGFTGTVKFVGSLKDTIPDFSAASSASNPRENILVKDYMDGASITGDTGLTGSATTDVRVLEFNSNGLVWFGAIVSSYSAGTLTVKLTGFNDF